MFFNQMLKTELRFQFFFPEKSEFVKLKIEVRRIIDFCTYVIFSSMRNVENRKKSCR